MKQTYIKPEILFENTELEQMIAVSLMDSTVWGDAESDGEVLSRRNLWDDYEEDE